MFCTAFSTDWLALLKLVFTLTQLIYSLTKFCSFWIWWSACTVEGDWKVCGGVKEDLELEPIIYCVGCLGECLVFGYSECS